MKRRTFVLSALAPIAAACGGSDGDLAPGEAGSIDAKSHAGRHGGPVPCAHLGILRRAAHVHEARTGEDQEDRRATEGGDRCVAGDLAHRVEGVGVQQEAAKGVAHEQRLAELAELLAEEDVVNLAAAMEPGSTAGVLIWENLWAAPFAAAARRSGGQLIADGRIPIQAIIAAIEADDDELIEGA